MVKDRGKRKGREGLQMKGVISSFTCSGKNYGRGKLYSLGIWENPIVKWSGTGAFLGE